MRRSASFYIFPVTEALMRTYPSPEAPKPLPGVQTTLASGQEPVEDASLSIQPGF